MSHHREMREARGIGPRELTDENKFKFPEKLKIGDHYWRVRVVNRISGSKKKYAGMCYPHLKLICILSDQSQDEALKTLFHECIHAAEQEYDIVLSHKGVYQFEEAIFDFLMANLEAFNIGGKG